MDRERRACRVKENWQSLRDSKFTFEIGRLAQIGNAYMDDKGSLFAAFQSSFTNDLNKGGLIWRTSNEWSVDLENVMSLLRLDHLPCMMKVLDLLYLGNMSWSSCHISCAYSSFNVPKK